MWHGCDVAPLATSPTRLFLITGIMAAGKSTVAQRLAERFDRSAHVRGDTFRRSVVSGRAEMSAEPTEEAIDQLRLRYELAASCADRYVEAGFTTVLQDVVVGPMLAEMVNLIVTRPLAVIVLAPSATEVQRREQQREKTGYRDFTPADFDTALRTETPPLGLWLDSSNHTVDETVDAILASAESEALV